MPSKDETVEDRPAAHWACVEAVERINLVGRSGIRYNWDKAAPAFKELARMIEKYEKPPVSPELLAAREFLVSNGGACPTWRQAVLAGKYDDNFVIRYFLAGVAWAKENN